MPNEPVLTEDQWIELRDEINRAILNGLDTPDKIENLRIQIARLVSHVDSERRVEQISSRQLYEHHQLLYGVGEADGLKGKMNELMKTLALFRKVIWSSVAVIISLSIKAIWDVISKGP